MLVELTPEKLNLCKNRVITTSTDIYHIGNNIIQEDQAQSERKSFGILTDEKNIVKTVIDLSEEQTQKIKADSIIRCAQQVYASKIFIADAYPHSIKDVREDNEQVKYYLSLSKTLAKKKIILADIVIHERSSYSAYSGFVSRELFPEFARDFADHHFKENKFTFSDRESREATLGIIASGWREEAPPHLSMNAIFLDNKDEVLSVRRVPLNFAKVIPGILDDQKCSFQKTFQQAILDNAASLVLVQTVNPEREMLHANAEDCAMLHQARAASKLYNDFPIKDYILVQPCGVVSSHYHTSLSFAETYGLQ